MELIIERRRLNDHNDVLIMMDTLIVANFQRNSFEILIANFLTDDDLCPELTFLFKFVF